MFIKDLQNSCMRERHGFLLNPKNKERPPGAAACWLCVSTFCKQMHINKVQFSLEIINVTAGKFISKGITTTKEK
jgi:hypothetical protein